MSTIGETSRTLVTVETTSLPSAASSLSANDGAIAPPNNSGGADNEDSLSKASIGAIVGGVVGGFALVIFIIVFLLRCGRRRKPSATAHKLRRPPQQPDCTPFTYLSSADTDTRRSRVATQLFTPIRKRREVISVPSPENNRSFVASTAANSDVTGIPFQHMVREKSSGIEAGFAVSEDFLNGSGHMYQEMRAEIERLQAQLADTLTSGFMDELPRYSRM
ncbi:hypothetical protein C0993_003462 [Termitomyces sp. T159_Od127]|nr:hypothetical protein C0993_003462 [Termitomyces sp. T159_Od127]